MEIGKKINFGSLFVAILTLAIIEILSLYFPVSLTTKTIILLQLYVVTFTAYRSNLYTALLTAIVSALLINFFHIEPLYSFNIKGIDRLVFFAVFLISALIICLLIHRIKQHYLNEQLQEIRKVEKLQRALLSSVSHDLRTPLVSIMGSISSILEYGNKFSEETKKELLQTAYNESERLNRYIGNLISMTRVEAGSLQLNCKLTDVTDIIRNAVRIVRKTSPPQLIKHDIDDNLPLIFIDPVMTEQVFINLIENAIKYSPDTSVILITTEFTPEAVIVRIQDKGRGLSPEELDRIFDRFYRTTSTTDTFGYGLGLAICKGILEAEDATISAASAGKDQGSVFTISFKRQKED